MDAVAPGGLGGTFGGNPVSCAAAKAVLDAARERAAACGGDRRPPSCGARSDGTPRLGCARPRADARARAAGADRRDRAAAVVRTAREQGLLLLTCGLYGNVIRILVPFAVTDEQLERGLEILERALGG